MSPSCSRPAFDTGVRKRSSRINVARIKRIQKRYIVFESSLFHKQQYQQRWREKYIMRSLRLVFCFYTAAFAFQIQSVQAIRPITAATAVALVNPNPSPPPTPAQPPKPALITQENLINFDVLLGVYCYSVFLFSPRILINVFFDYGKIFPLIGLRRICRLFVRLISVNHICYALSLRNLQKKVPERALKLATAEWAIYAAVVAILGGDFLGSTFSHLFWTGLTTLVLLAHWSVQKGSLSSQ